MITPARTPFRRADLISARCDYAVRILVGTIMAALAACMLIADLYLAPAYPFLLLVILLLAFGACSELHRLLRGRTQSAAVLVVRWRGVVVLLANWPVHILDYHLGGPGLAKLQFGLGPWQFVTFTFAAVVITAFVAEMPRDRDSTGSVPRIALTLWFVAYLGLLPSFFIQLRWPPPQYGALSMAIFVPKCGDIAAYFTGRLLGRHRMTPAIVRRRRGRDSSAASAAPSLWR